MGALCILGVAFTFQECKTGQSVSSCSQSDITLPTSWSGVTVAALMVYVSGYQVGFGPIAWLLISEVFPLKVRGAALSLAAMVNFSSNIVMTLTQQVLQDALGSSGTFFSYFVLAVFSIF